MKAAAAILFAGMIGATVSVHAAPRAALFPFELLDTSGEGVHPGQTERLAAATRLLGQLLLQSGPYDIVSTAAFASRLNAMRPLYACGTCWAPVARQAGATVAVLASVHKVSTLVSIMNISIVDLATMRFAARAEGQIRGDTDEAYARGVRFLVSRELLKGRP